MQVHVGQFDCPQPSEPPHDVQLLARQRDEPDWQLVATGTTDASGNVSFTQHPLVTTHYGFRADATSGPVISTAERETAYLLQTTGPCAGAVSVTSPTSALYSRAVPLSITTTPSTAVHVLFRGMTGSARFSVRRELQADAAGRVDTSYVANDDYAVFASTAQCDSEIHPIVVRPLMSGPATAARGTSVAVAVRARATDTVSVWFHRAGTSGYTLRRRSLVGTGLVYQTTYIADADYRYYATIDSGRTSNIVLTQVRPQ
ncbi:MAG: hypothetical protein ABR520_03540 [Mycobacteriales bacterium]